LPRPCHRLFACTIHAVIASGIAGLVALACVGAAMEHPGGHHSHSAKLVAAHATLLQPTMLQAAEHPQAVNLSSRNLQLPRAPRHRSERPTSGSIDAEALAATKLVAFVDDESCHSFVGDSLNGCPLAGHPLSLLRPPSLLAG
jgi:hypothetical protein